jgi:hypothetical protein
VHRVRNTSGFNNAITAVTTAVELISFGGSRDGPSSSRGGTGSGSTIWAFTCTGRSLSSGPYDRITDAVIPGLGSSPMGARLPTPTPASPMERAISKLEDIETTGGTELHGPISAVPGESDESVERTTYSDPQTYRFEILERSPRESSSSS